MTVDNVAGELSPTFTKVPPQCFISRTQFWSGLAPINSHRHQSREHCCFRSRRSYLVFACIRTWQRVHDNGYIPTDRLVVSQRWRSYEKSRIIGNNNKHDLMAGFAVSVAACSERAQLSSAFLPRCVLHRGPAWWSSQGQPGAESDATLYDWDVRCNSR